VSLNEKAQHIQETAGVISDSVLAASVLTSPWWLDAIETYLHIYILAGGAALLTFRIRRAWLNRNKP
jgi:hypothetical protein